MLALLVDWRGRPIERPVMRRMAASLGAGLTRRAVPRPIAPGVFAATSAPAECLLMASGSTMLFTGVIQNRAELHSALGLNLCADAALYAAAWERFAEAAEVRVIGEYAAVIINPSGTEVRLIRAPIQAPPLHCYRSPHRFMVSSNARAIFGTGLVEPKIDEQKIADSLYLNYSEAERGWYEGITRVPVGSRALETGAGSRVTRYYNIAKLPSIYMKSEDDYVEHAWELLAEGTRAALDGFSCPAIALSGGLDSQAVAVQAMLALQPGQNLLGLTGIPEPGWPGDAEQDRFGDEREHVAALAALYPKLRTETVDAAGRSFDYRLAEMFFHAGGPPRNAMNLHWLHDLHGRAKAEGCDVLLNGAMGNFSFSFDGSGAFANWFKRGQWLRLGREAALLPANPPRMRFFLNEAVRPHLPRSLDGWFSRLRSGTGSEKLPDWCPLNAEYARHMRVVERTRDTANPKSTLEWRVAMLRGAAGEMGDVTQAMEQIHGLPVRDPTAYRPLVEFCLGIPDDQFWGRGVRRRLAKRMLRQRIPDRTIDEPRIGEQCADWFGRLQRDLAALRNEVAGLRDDPEMCRRFDLDRLALALDEWPHASPIGAQQLLLQLAVPRALATARFVQWVEGTNGNAIGELPGSDW